MAIEGDGDVQREAIQLLINLPDALDLTEIEDFTTATVDPVRAVAVLLLKPFLQLPETEPIIIRLLDDPHSGVVLNTLKLLLDLPTLSPQIESRLPRLLEFTDIDIQRATLKLIAKSSDADLVSQVYKLFVSTNSAIVIEDASNSLINLAERFVIEGLNPALIEVFRLGIYSQKRQTLKILEKSGDVQVAEQLLNFLQDDNYSNFHFYLLNTIEVIGDETLTPRITNMLNNQQPSIKQNAISLVGGMKLFALRPQILKLLNDENSNVVQSCLGALGEIGSLTDIPIILSFIDADDEHIAENAIRTLGKLGGGAVIDHIVTKLYSEDYFVLHAAIDAVSNLKAKEAIPALIKIACDDASSLQTEAISALYKLDAKNQIEPFLISWLNDEDSDIRYLTAEYLGTLRTRDWIDALISKIDDRSSYTLGRVCDAVVKSLEQIGSPKALSAVKSWKKRQPVSLES